MYQERRDILVNGLRSLGWQVTPPKATFYLWVKVPNAMKSIDFAALLLQRANIVVTPGIGFGESAEGYVRFALTVPQARIKEAVERLKKVL